MSFKDLVKLTAPHKWHNKVKTLRRLEKMLHANEEGMIATEQDVFLKFCVLYLFEIQQYIFPDCLNRPLLRSWISAEFCQKDLTKSAFSEESLLLEVFIAHIIL